MQDIKAMQEIKVMQTTACRLHLAKIAVLPASQAIFVGTQLRQSSSMDWQQQQLQFTNVVGLAAQIQRTKNLAKSNFQQSILNLQ